MQRRCRAKRIEDAIHIASYGAGIGQFVDMRNAIPLRDALYLGPCDPDPEQHGERRREYWLSVEREVPALSNSRARGNLRYFRESLDRNVHTADQLALVMERFPRDVPVVLWSTPTWPDRLQLWWTLDALQRSEVPPDQIWLADSQVTESESCLSADAPIEWHGEALVRRAFRHLEPIGRQRLRVGAALWRKFAAKSPAAFDKSRRAGTRLFPELPRISDAYGFFFPVLAQGRMRPSAIDQLLLDELARKEWVRPYDIIVQLDGDHPLTHYCPEPFVAHRLQQWANHEPDRPVLDCEPRSGANSLTSIAYRLTVHGKRLLNEGLEHPEDAPGMYVGGCQIYAGKPCWVRAGKKANWRLQRIAH